MPILRLTKRSIDALPVPSKTEIYWDADLKGFGLRITAGDVRAFIVDYRTPSAERRRIVVGRLGVLTPDEARVRARDLLADVTKGGDPGRERREAKEALTVAELCERYMVEARAGRLITRFKRSKSETTTAIDEGRISRHIVPLLGRRRAASIEPADVQRMVDDISAGKTAGVFKTGPRGKARVTGGAGNARRVAGLLGGVFTWAIKRNLVPGPNPVRQLQMRADGTRDRALTLDELGRLGAVLRARSRDAPMATAVVRLIALTGLRFSEAVELEWTEVDVDGQCLRLAKSKTGASRRPIGRPALEHILSLKRVDTRLVFPGGLRAKPDADSKPREKRPAQLRKVVSAIFDAAGLQDARAHDLRRTFATIAANSLDLSDGTIAELLGHAKQTVTERNYIRRYDAALLNAATAVSTIVANALDGRSAQVVSLQTAEART